MLELRSYAIFISHAWANNSDYYRLEEILYNALNFIWRNYSVPQHDRLDTATNWELEEASDSCWHIC